MPQRIIETGINYVRFSGYGPNFVKYGESYSRRRAVKLASFGLGVFFVPKLSSASQFTGIDALDTAAIPVKAPANVLLVAIARAGDRLVAVGEEGVIVYSDDSGLTWFQANVPVDLTLTCIGFATPSHGWAAGHFGVVLNTVDGGETWQVQLNGLQANKLTLIAAQNAVKDNSKSPGVPLAMKRAGFFVESGPSKPFLALLALSPQQVIVFGSYRMAMRTTDGGKTWEDWSLNIYDSLSNNIYDATAVGSQIYLVGENGLVFRSNDSGMSFLPVTSPSADTLFGIVGANDGSIIVFGVAGSGFRSTDAGNTWNSLNLGTQDNFTAGRLLQSRDIILTTEAGTCYFSIDDGATFKVVEGIPPMSIFDVEQAPDGELVFVGDAGAARVSLSVLPT